MYISSINIPDDVELYFIGDIHGQFSNYVSALRNAGVGKNDVVISVGDLIDRGPQNFKCLAEFLRNPNRYMVMGNHEDLMINGLSSRSHYHCWYQNGGDASLEEFGEYGTVLLAELIREAKVPIALEISHRGKKFLVVHGGIDESIPDLQTLHAIIHDPKIQEDLVWNRNMITRIMKFSETPSNFGGVDYTIHGHTGTKGPVLSGNRLWIDTKFVEGTLTLAQFDGTKFVFHNELGF